VTADHCALAVDVGGTKFAAAAVCGDGTVLTRTEIPVPRTTGPAAMPGSTARPH
jgi:predicted NBD/HSP70 family sugar kinase